MDTLLDFDCVYGYKFGTVDIDFDSAAYVKFDDDNVYVITDEIECDLMTFKPVESTFILNLEDVELEMELGSIYFIKPAPYEHIDAIENCNVKRYSLVTKAKVNVGRVSDKLDFVRDHVINSLKSIIGSKKLALTRWPFENVSLAYFLEKCAIPHNIILKFSNEYYLYDKNVEILSTRGPDGQFNKLYQDLKTCSFQKLKAEKIKTNGYLFYIDRRESKIKKKIDYYDVEREWVVKGPMKRLYVEHSKIGFEHEEAFVIFNPDTPTSNNDEKVVFPTAEPHYQTII